MEKYILELLYKLCIILENIEHFCKNRILDLKILIEEINHRDNLVDIMNEEK